MIHRPHRHDTKNFLRRHNMYIKSDYNKFSLYAFFCPIEPFQLLFLLYANHLLGSYAIAGMLLSLKMVITLILQVLFSGIKDRMDLKYTLAFAEFFCAIGYVFFTITHLFEGYITAFLCIGIFFLSIGSALWRGTYNSFIYEDFEKDKPEIGSKPYSKLQTIFSIGSAAGVMVSATLAGMYSYSIAMSFGILTNIIAGVLALTLKGPKNCKTPEECLVKGDLGILHFVKAVKKMFANEKLRYISTAEIVRFALLNSFNNFAIPFYTTFMPISSIGYVETIKGISVAIGFSLSDGIIKKFKFYKAVKLFYIIRLIIITAAIAVNSLMSPILIVFRSLFYGPMVTSVEYMMQKNYSSKERVTMSSSLNILSGMLSAVFITILGYIAEKYSVQNALMILIPFYIIPYLLYKKQFRVLGKE